MPSYFSAAAASIPPLMDIPQELVSMVLHGGMAPGGERTRVPSSALLSLCRPAMRRVSYSRVAQI